MKERFNVFAVLSTAFLLGACTTPVEERPVGEKIVIGVRPASGVLSYRSAEGRYVGYHVEICQKIVDNYMRTFKVQKIDIEYRPVTAQSRMSDVVNGVVDLECGSTNNTLERQKSVDFLPTAYVMEGRIFVTEDSAISSLQDLKGKRIGVLSGTTVAQALKDLLAQQSMAASLVPVPLDEIGRALQNKEVDAIAIDVDLFSAKRSLNPALKVKAVGPVFHKEPIGIMLAKKPGRLRDIAYQTMDSLLKTGEIEAIYKSWFEGPVPAPLAPMNMPASDATRQAWARRSSQP